MGIRVGTYGRQQNAGEAERERVFQRVDAGIYDGGIEARELLLERDCVRLAGEKRGSVKEVELGVVRRRLQSSLEGLVGVCQRVRRLLGQSGASGCKIGLSACE